MITDVRLHTHWLTSATTFPTLCTTDTPVSSILNICIGFESRCNLPHAPPNLAKKSEIVSLLAQIARLYDSGCGIRIVTVGLYGET